MKLCLLLLVGCGSVTAKQPDAAPDVAIDTFPTGSGAHYHYILDSVTVPTSSTEARADGFDLNGDGTIDNQIGAVDAALKSQGGFDVQADETKAVDDGQVLMLADLQTPDLTSATDAGYTMYVGMNPSPAPCNGNADTVCRHHLAGNGTFDVAATPRDPQLLGAIAGGVLQAGPGHLSLQLTIGGSSPRVYTLLGARVQMTATTTTLMQGKLGGAITVSDINTKLVPAMQESYSAIVARDCTMLSSPPSCGCFSGSSGATILSFFDANHDCTVTTTEIAQNSLFMSLLQPDVSIEGQMCLSLGVGVTGVGATFTP